MNALVYENKDELIKYVLDSKRNGYSEYEIAATLIAAEWDPVHVENAMLHAQVKEYEDGLVFHAITGITLMSVIFLLAVLV